MGKPRENHGKTMGKPWENHGKTMGKPWEKSWKSGTLWKFNSELSKTTMFKYV